MTTFILGLILLLLALFGTPLFAIISAIALLAFYFADIELTVVIIELYRLASQPILLAIPLFTFAGYLLAESKAPTRLINFSRAFFGWIPGGLSIVTLVACAIFTALTGASGVTIIALGGLLYFSWVIPATLIVLGLAVVYRGFLLALPAATRRRFLLAAALYLGGALAMELPLGYWTSRHGVDNLGYGLIDWLEETLELAGASLFCYALLLHLLAAPAGLGLSLQRSGTTRGAGRD